MGFGIALIGYAFLLLTEIGGAVIGAPMLAYGFFLASRFDRRFLYAAISSLFMLPRGIVNLLDAVGLLDLSNMPTLNTVTFMLYLAAWLVMSLFWLPSVAQIASDNGDEKLGRQANNRLYFTSVFIVFSVVLAALNMSGALGNTGFPAMALQYILQYAVIIVNVLFLHTCFVLITSEKQYEKDLQYIASEDAKVLEKKHRDEMREAEINEKRNRRKGK